MSKQLAIKLLKLYYSDYKKSFITTTLIFFFICVVYFVVSGFKFSETFVYMPFAYLLMVTFMYCGAFTKYLYAKKDIKKNRIETKYIIVENVVSNRRGFIAGKNGNVFIYSLLDENKEMYNVAMVNRRLSDENIQALMIKRKWQITYLKNSRVILNIQLNNSVLKDPKENKLEQKVRESSKEIFGVFGKKA